MEPVMKQLDIHLTFEAFEVYLNRFEIWSMTKEDLQCDKIVAKSLTFIWKVYRLLKTSALPDKPISVPDATLNELLLNYVKCTRFGCCERADVHKTIHQNNQNVGECITELWNKLPNAILVINSMSIYGIDRSIDWLSEGINMPDLEG